MARINLLPWREERRKLRNREAQALFAASALVAVLAVFAILYQYDRLIEGQLARNRLLEAEIAAVDTKIKEVEGFERERDRLLARKEIIERLQSSRSQMVYLFDELARTIPDGVSLSSVKQEGDQLVLEGTAESNARVSEYMRNLENSRWMDSPDLRISEAKGSDRRARYVFNLRVNLKQPAVSEDDASDSAVATGAGAGGAP